MEANTIAPIVNRLKAIQVIVIRDRDRDRDRDKEDIPTLHRAIRHIVLMLETVIHHITTLRQTHTQATAKAIAKVITKVTATATAKPRLTQHHTINTRDIQPIVIQATVMQTTIVPVIVMLIIIAPNRSRRHLLIHLLSRHRPRFHPLPKESMNTTREV